MFPISLFSSFLPLLSLFPSISLLSFSSPLPIPLNFSPLYLLFILFPLFPSLLFPPSLSLPLSPSLPPFPSSLSPLTPCLPLLSLSVFLSSSIRLPLSRSLSCSHSRHYCRSHVGCTGLSLSLSTTTYPFSLNSCLCERLPYLFLFTQLLIIRPFQPHRYCPTTVTPTSPQPSSLAACLPRCLLLINNYQFTKKCPDYQFMI